MSPKNAARTSLVSSKDPAQWTEHLSAYEARVGRLGKDDLEEVDRWYRALPQVIEGRGTPGHITAEELVRIVDWKLKRGKWRPRLLQFAQSHSDKAVEAASGTAFRNITAGKLGEALASLTELKGIGPATASAVLAARSPEQAPFMSDEAMAAVFPGRSIKYSAKEYTELAAELQKKATELNREQDDRTWTASDVERSLWSAAHEFSTKKPVKRKADGGTVPDEVSASKSKRKRKK